MKSINETCIELSIDPAAFAKTLRCAMEVAWAKKALSDALSSDFSALREESLTDDEEQALKAALRYTIGE
ncbi:MAG: hypothetical protein WBJ84_05030 [Bacteroidales bacterium]